MENEGGFVRWDRIEQVGLAVLDVASCVPVDAAVAADARRRPNWSYRRILVTEGVRRQRLELAI